MLTSYDNMHSDECPFCKSNNINSDDIEIPDGKQTFAVVECSDCGKKWKDIWTLTHFEEIT